MLSNTDQRQEKVRCEQLRATKDEQEVLRAKGYHSNRELSHILKGIRSAEMATRISITKD